MTIRKSDGRHLIQLTMAPALYFELRDHCQKLDTTITVWARNLIRRALADAATTDATPPTPSDSHA
jgi:hypothetical protein